MAYNLRNINVLDLRPSTGIGVALPFSSPSVFTTVYTTKDQLKYNIINFLLTNPRERVFVPGFGAGIRQTLFEQISTETLDALEARIRSGVESNFPNVAIATLDVGSDPDNNLIVIQFSYIITNTRESDNIILNLNGQ